MAPTRRTAQTIKEAFVWYYFLPLRSEAGERWCQIFHSSGAERTVQELDILVARMRHPMGCLDTLFRELDEIRYSTLFQDQTVPPSIRGVVEEAYRGALAYWHYRRGSLDAADAELTLALDSVNRTLSSDENLLTYALKIIQLITNRGRIARSQRDWTRMALYLNTCEQMLADDLPIHGSNTSIIHLNDICSFYRGIEPSSALDADALTLLSDPKSISMSFRDAIHSVWKSLHIPNDY